MRLTTVILIASLMQVSAAGFAQKITLKQDNVSLESVLKEIRKQSGYDYYYGTKVVPKNQKVNISVNNVSVNEALEVALRGLKLTYEIEGRTISIKKKEPSLLEAVVSKFKEIDVRGRIVGADGVPLSGATIKVKGTSIEVVSNEKGEFYLKGVDNGAILEITYIGYKSQEIKARSNLGDVQMESFAGDLEEVQINVSTGYQTLSKERSAGSFSKPDMKVVADRSTSMNILQRLDGLIPGFTINNAPVPTGTAGNQYSIRGLSTLGIGSSGTGTQRNPLFVVDGIAIDNIESINPQDVSDITVLKDATAASIWGARAANGVIVITTKRGRANEKLKIQYDAFINFQGKPDLDYLPTLNSRQYIQTVSELFAMGHRNWEDLTQQGLTPHETILYNWERNLISEDEKNSSLESLASLNNHKQIKDLFYRAGSIQNHTVSLNGGGKAYSFYGSAAYTNTVSEIQGEKNNSYKINLRQDFNVNKRLQFYLITDLTNTITSSKRSPSVDYSFLPYQMFRDANGNNISMPYINAPGDSTRRVWEALSGVSLDYSPLDDVNTGYTKNDGLFSRITGGVKIDLLKGLRFEGVYGYVKGTSRATDYNDASSYASRLQLVGMTTLVDGEPKYLIPNYGGTYNVNNINQRNWTIRNQFVYDNAWQDRKHQVTFLVGQEAQDQLTIINSTTALGYDQDLQTSAIVDYVTLDTSAVAAVTGSRANLTISPFSQSDLQTRFTSYYGNGGYTYNQKYTINGSLRFDKSNLFGLDKSAQNRPAWSAGLKWTVGAEDFMKNVPWVNMLAMRATYGITGNSPAPGSSSSYNVLGPVVDVSLPGGSGFDISSVANPLLTWESTKTLNLGLDFSVLNSRINGSVDFYDKKTKDLLGDMPVNGFTGHLSIIGNFGRLENKGVELSINSLNIDKRDFSWSSNLVLAYNKNTITELNRPSTTTTADLKILQRFETGYPAFTVFAYKYAGLNAEGDPQIYLKDGTITSDGFAASPEDIVFMGTFQPVWSGGFSNTFRYKNFSLSGNATFNLGHVMRRDLITYSPGASYGEFSGRITNNSGLIGGQIHPDFLNRWKVPGDEKFTNIPRYIAESESPNRKTAYYDNADINVVSASYIKLRDLSLSYSLPKSLVNRIQAESVSLRLQLTNVMLWKANKDDIDPELHNAFDGRRTVAYRFGQGAISFGVNVNF